MVFGHRQTLAEQLRAEDDGAMALHLACVIAFQTLTNAMIHCPGRMVPVLIQEIKPLMEEEKHAVFVQFQGKN